ncbi:TlpA family protein disulfide reductase [Alicyclobacillus ferrooxydans]|uniref:Thioredoxin domain-containing protein n=1 Tax=Alicyclobacillus ferrooxydans TaxID=471514 RepID=A0A0P9CIX1_9BACL|nr:TlpA disulfide reductase family protein [Alicyclobacillus ferrooxydans]KPV45578.1 hypothetical protein AN477_01220 [Alicyclobacillus ferrooxydans]
MSSLTRRTKMALVFAVISSLVLGFCLWLYGKHEAPASVGDMAPNITAVTTSGNAFALNSLRGQTVVLDFFTPWCAPCIQETPDLIHFTKKYEGKVHVVLIDRGDGAGFVRDYVQQYHTPSFMTVLINPNDNWSLQYGVTGQPETFFITPSGKIVRHTVGPLTEQSLAQYAADAGMKTD